MPLTLPTPPTAPSLADPTNFDTRTDAFLAWMSTLATTWNATPPYISGDSPTFTDLNLTDTFPVLKLTDSDGTFQSTDIFNSGGSTTFRSRNNTADGQFTFAGYGGGVETNRLRIQPSGDVSFYNDAGTTVKFNWDASTERLGVGTSTPSVALDVVGAILSTEEHRAEVIPYASNQDQPYLIAGSTGWTGATTNWGTFGYQHRFKSDGAGAGRITIDTLSGEAFSVKSTAGIMIVTVEDELHALGGIHLGGTTASNLLDDYEEGTFTPTLLLGGASVGMTFSTQTGEYTKKGREVTAIINLTLSAKGSSTGSVTVGSLPFTSGVNSPIAVRFRDLSFADTLVGYVGDGTTIINVQEVTNSGVITNTSDANLSSTSSLMIKVVYNV